MMRYTKNKPTERGWYWYIELGHASGSLVFVSERPGHAYLCIQVEPSGFSTKRDFRPVAKMHGDWAGPLIEPQPLHSPADSEEHF